jgi:outer membrane receptor for ferrienterochelin and colicins
MGSQVDYRFTRRGLGSLTLGAVAQVDLRALMKVVDLEPAEHNLFVINKRDRSTAVFAQDELTLAPHWTLNLGARLDASGYRRSFVSQRAALIYAPSAHDSYKLMYGKAFRDPTAFELFYTDPGAQTIGNPNARPEVSNTIEVAVERRLASRVNSILSVYRYRIDDLIVGNYTPEGLLQYQNDDTIKASGVEMELNGHPVPWLEMAASMAFQRSVNSTDHTSLPNSPGRIGKLRASVSLFRRMSLASSNQYMSSRETLAGATLPSVLLSDLVVSTNRFTADTDFQFGVRNVGNVKFADPLALNSKVDTLPSAGRSLFVSVTLRR